MLLPHVPWIFLPSTRRFDKTVLGPITGLNSSERSVFDRTLVRQSWQRHLLQTGAVDTLLGEMVAQMKRTDLWDRALVVVMSDHGVSFRVGATDRRTIVPGEREGHRPGGAVHQVPAPAAREDRPLTLPHIRRAAHDCCAGSGRACRAG